MVLIAGTCATGPLQGTEATKEAGEDGMAAYIDHSRFPPTLLSCSRSLSDEFIRTIPHEPCLDRYMHYNGI